MIDFVLIPEERVELLKKDKKFLKLLSQLTGVKLTFNEEVQLESDDAIKLMKAKQIVLAIGRGFLPNDALDLVDEEYHLLILNIKDWAGKSRKRIITLKGRVIGEGGKTKRIIEQLTDTKLAIYGKTISIIGRWQDAEKAREAITMLLSGSQHSTVYRFLERSRS
jgi:ribosomal RNA assembly protein